MFRRATADIADTPITVPGALRGALTRWVTLALPKSAVARHWAVSG